ncbi:S-type pyocin domain-containing protein [Pseudomonas aeruginosa]|uniref:S-type pyocin domain-containing protein n=1 Tax=Pseudomonas aeruginosa TaxID=287 RepID=UPI0009A337EC
MIRMPRRYPEPCIPARPNRRKEDVYLGQDPIRPTTEPDPPQAPEPPPRPRPSYSFTKCRKLPDSHIDYEHGAGPFPVDTAKDYGNLVLLGGREADEQGQLQLKRISGAMPAGFGTLALRGLATSGGACAGLCSSAISGGQAVVNGGRAAGAAVLSGGVVAGTLVGLVAMLWPSSLSDSALYSEEELRTIERGRTRVRLRIEEQPDGTLKGYGYNTQLRRDWEMIPVVQFTQVGTEMVADLGDGIGLIWTPAADPADTLGIPALETAPQAPHIWIFPPTEQADNIIVNPVYPPEYRDFILVFPAGSGVQPLYIVLNARHEPGVVTGVGEDVLGIWLAGASEGVGVPIPTRIADELRGRSFNSFDSFRRAFWTAVSKDADLRSQFRPVNQKLLDKGYSPFTREADRVGGREKYELHHDEEVAMGGKVYDVDNLTVVTPRRHIDIHKGANS